MALDIEGFQSALAEVETMRSELKAREDALRGDMIAQIQQLIDTMNLKASDFRFAEAPKAPAPRRPRNPIAPKYRGPNGELWTGRGRTPRWLAEQLDLGRKVEDFLIQAAE
ncbi:H-NS histone family protein [Sutterella sp.]|uniref:H-NS histone family protein n=1 Tax=Sutterella sp. TaxID=1981025 RepID=UPI0026DF5848|nr:H-NS histone family protein [Sutterella sp.]MDO5532259.1 H-NS histone family protein [Sutterella sp.]